MISAYAHCSRGHKIGRLFFIKSDKARGIGYGHSDIVVDRIDFAKWQKKTKFVRKNWQKEPTGLVQCRCGEDILYETGDECRVRLKCYRPKLFWIKRDIFAFSRKWIKKCAIK